MRTDAEWYALDEAVIAGVERLRFFPQVAASARGSWLTTPGGREVLDLSASWTASGFGHGHPAIVEAVGRAVSQQAGASLLSGAHPEAVLLAQELLDIVPTVGADRRVYLGHAGTDANAVAIQGARRMTGRPRIIAFEGGYHGGFGASLAVSGLHISAGTAPDPDLTLIPYPNPREPWTGDVTSLLPATLERVEELLRAGDVAAVFAEPIQSDGGVLVPPEGFLAGLREVTDAHDVLLVVDEVKVGLGRTGHLMAHHAEEVTPDLVTVGKALGGGLPLAATIGPSAALDVPAASALMTTVGNPVSCAAGRAVLTLLADGTLARQAHVRGKQLVDGLQAYAGSDRPGAERVGDVRGRGLALGIELVDVGGARDPMLTAKAVFAGWNLGVVAYAVRDNVIELTPALTISEEEGETAIDLLTQAIDHAAMGEVSDDDIAAYGGW